MFTTYITVVLSAAAAVSASVLPRTATAAAKYPVPSTYAALWLEKYEAYHTRYLALDCEDKHNTQFFDDCCHPMLKWEQLSTARKPYCVPGAVVSTSGVISSTAVATKTATPTSAALIASPTSSVGQECTEDSDDCECVDDDGEGEECEEGEEDCVCEDEEPTSSAAHSSTPAPSATHSSTASRSTVLVTSTVTASTATSSVAKASTATSSVESASTATSSVESASTATSSKETATSAKPTSTETPSSTVKPTSTTASSSSAAATSSVPITQQTTGTLTGGAATFFYQGGVAGACGTVHPDSAMIAAIDGRRYGNLGAVSPLCGVQAKVTNEKNGKSVIVTIADACPTCGTENSIDLSSGAFTQIATEEEGEVPVTIVLLGKN